MRGGLYGMIWESSYLRQSSHYHVRLDVVIDLGDGTMQALYVSYLIGKLMHKMRYRGASTAFGGRNRNCTFKTYMPR